MTRVVLWSSSAGDVPANLAFTNNFTAITNPGVGNDISQGYTNGSVWINTVTDEVFTCTDQTKGAALWQLTSTGSSTPGIVLAPAASTPTGAGSAAGLVGGTGGTTSGAGGASNVTGGAATAGNSAGGATTQTGGAGSGSGAGGAVGQAGGVGGATGAGGAASIVGGAGGATSGAGGNASVTGGAGSAGNANGGDVTISGGAPNGTGVAGVVRESGVVVRQQGAPGTLNATGTLTAALMLTGIVTTTSAAAVAATLDLAANLDTALPSSIASDSFDFSVINTGPNTLTVGTATGWTLVGVMTVLTNVSGRFRARKTGAGAWTLYRIS